MRGFRKRGWLKRYVALEVCGSINFPRRQLEWLVREQESLRQV
jgi:hypothetical protein